MTIEITQGVILAITIGLTEVFKLVMPESTLRSRITPLVAILFALGLSAGAVGLTFDGLIFGLVTGLSSVGLFSSAKSVIKG